MKMNGEQLILAPREIVWNALNDPEILKQSIAGCTELVKNSKTEFSAKVTAKVGPVKAKFAGDVKLSKLQPPKSYVISGQGKGGAAGFAKGGASVQLDDHDGQTLLTYNVDAQVGGKLAQIGSRLIQSTARKMADDFFKKFAKLAAQNAETAPVRKATATKKTAVRKAAANKSSAPAKKKRPASKTKQTAAPSATLQSTPAKPVSAVPGSLPQDEKPNKIMWWVGGIALAVLLIYLLAS